MSAAPAPTTLAELRGASKRFGKILALDRVDLQIRPAEVLALLGPNGAGKTTALGLLTGAIKPSAGAASLFDDDPQHWRARQQIGVMQQSASLVDTLRVVELVRQFSAYYPAPRPIEQTLTMAGLETLADRRYAALSGGQQRRVQFALAICGNPPLLFVDEPTVGLDVSARRDFWRILRELRQQGTGIVLTTHYLDEADALADRIVMIADGRILAHGSPTEIKSRAAGKKLRFRTSIELAALAHWQGVLTVEQQGELTELQVTHAESILRRLLDADAELSDLQVLPLSLEDAFLSLNEPARQSPHSETRVDARREETA